MGNGTIWEQIGQDVDGLSGHNSGTLVSLSADGLIVTIGAKEVCSNIENGINPDAFGDVMDHQFNDESLKWEQLGERIYGDHAGDEFGWSVNLSPDGSTLAIGRPLLEEDMCKSLPVKIRQHRWRYLESDRQRHC